MAKQGGKRHSPEQIVHKLSDGDAMLNAGKSVAEVVQHLGVSEQAYYRWKTQSGGMKSEEAKPLKELEVENARLKKLLAAATCRLCRRFRHFPRPQFPPLARRGV